MPWWSQRERRPCYVDRSRPTGDQLSQSVEGRYFFSLDEMPCLTPSPTLQATCCFWRWLMTCRNVGQCQFCTCLLWAEGQEAMQYGRETAPASSLNSRRVFWPPGKSKKIRLNILDTESESSAVICWTGDVHQPIDSDDWCWHDSHWVAICERPWKLSRALLLLLLLSWSSR